MGQLQLGIQNLHMVTVKSAYEPSGSSGRGLCISISVACEATSSISVPKDAMLRVPCI